MCIAGDCNRGDKRQKEWIVIPTRLRWHIFENRQRGKVDERRYGSDYEDAPSNLHSLPNVKDEPRPRPARLLQPSIDHSASSFRFALVSRRRDGRGRWLWRLVGL